MWHSIAEKKNKHKGEEGILIGPGPSSDILEDVLSGMKRPIKIGINRAIVLRNDFNYIFIDHPTTISIIQKFLGRTKAFCMPLYSRESLNINDDRVVEIQERVLLYSWVYEVDALLESADYSLNDILLYIAWGCAQSAIHFAKQIGLEKLTIIGCDGGPVNGQLSAKKIEEIFKKYNPVNAKKRTSHYEKARTKFEYIADKLDLELEIIRL